MIGEGFNLDEHEMLLVQLATWFHDTGYSEGPEEHEERSCVNAEAFLKGKIPDADLETIKGCIRSTKVPQRPTSILEQIICDADLVATATSTNSRNYTFGTRLAKGESAAEIRDKMPELAEGVRTLRIARQLARQYKLHVPITSTLYNVVFQGLPVEKALEYLMT